MATPTTAATKTTQRKTTTPRTSKPKAIEPQVEPVGYEISLPEDASHRQALVDSYWTLKNVGAPIPDPIRIPVEDWITNVQSKQIEEQEAAIQSAQDKLNERVAHLNATGPAYIRNMMNNPFNLRLDSQQGNSNHRPRRIELKPRGVPGDMHPIREEDALDTVLITNLNMGFIEVIPAGEAQIIIEKQTRNMNTRVHTPTQILSNEYKILRDNGRNVAENPVIKIEAEYNSQGITVATIDQSVQQGRVDDKQFNRAGNLGAGLNRGNQSDQSSSQFIPTGGNPASISFDPLAINRIQDDIARRKGLEGPAAGLGNMTVTVAPTQRT
jgi:hypothetical protein